jgi:hypothetical protein
MSQIIPSPMISNSRGIFNVIAIMQLRTQMHFRCKTLSNHIRIISKQQLTMCIQEYKQHLKTYTHLNYYRLLVIIITSAHVSTMPPIHRSSSHANWIAFRISILESLPNRPSPLTPKEINPATKTLDFSYPSSRSCSYKTSWAACLHSNSFSTAYPDKY